jgi:hypothetical protein
MPKKTRIKPIIGDGYAVGELAEIMGNFAQFDHIGGEMRNPDTRKRTIERWLYRRLREGRLEAVPESKPIKITDRSFSDLVKGKVNLHD